MPIDIHTHTFNVRYLPLHGVIESRNSEWWAKGFGPALVWYLLWRSKSDPVIDSGVESFTSGAKSFDEARSAKIEKILTPPRNWTEEESEALATHLVEEASDDEDLIYADEIYEAVMKLWTEEAESLAPLDHAPEKLLSSMEDSAEGETTEKMRSYLAESRGKRSFNREERRWFLGGLFGVFRQLKGLFNWAVFMTKPESQILDTLVDTYRKGLPPDEKVLFIDHMMDMELHYPDPTNNKPVYEPSSVRAVRMQKLYSYAKGTVLGFYAWCPLRSDCMDLVKKALEEQAFCGVKFYPPNGYRALGNEGMDDLDVGCHVQRQSVSGATIDQRNRELFDYCEANRIPLFSHCQPGEMESVPKYSGRLSHPRFWRLALAEYPQLRLCLGHAGGAKHWLADFETDPWDFKDNFPDQELCCTEAEDSELDEAGYAKAVYEICTDTYEYVYSGTGAHGDVLKEKVVDNFQRRLELLFESSKTERERSFGERIMYGSDWHMIFSHQEHPAYRKMYEEIFEESTTLAPYRDRFFVQNALEFLQLSPYLERARSVLTGDQVAAIEYWVGLS